VNLDESGSYTCPECGEEVVVPVDASAGEDQEYVEDCPVCCSPVVLRVHVEPDGEISISASPE
jgi:predicted RNA-binding Zn-ribbon protein involved in translation (DUF1610 family)